LGVIPLAAGVVTTLRTSAKNSVRKLIDYTTYDEIDKMLIQRGSLSFINILDIL